MVCGLPFTGWAKGKSRQAGMAGWGSTTHMNSSHLKD